VFDKFFWGRVKVSWRQRRRDRQPGFGLWVYRCSATDSGCKWIDVMVYVWVQCYQFSHARNPESYREGCNCPRAFVAVYRLMRFILRLNYNNSDKRRTSAVRSCDVSCNQRALVSSARSAQIYTLQDSSDQPDIIATHESVRSSCARSNGSEVAWTNFATKTHTYRRGHRQEPEA